VNLSLTLTFFSVIFWAVVLGPIGAVLAIPATLLVRAMLLELDPEAVWARWVTGDQVEPPGAAPPPDAPLDAPPGARRATPSNDDPAVDESATTA
jgi:AI-2 transport protein TqsA